MFKLILGFLLIAQFATAQIQVNFSGDPSAPQGSTVDVDISVADFNQIVLFQYSINWDSTVMTFNSIQNVTSVLPQFTEAGNIGNPTAAAVDEGELTVSWSLASTEPVTIPDNTILFTARFNVVGDPCSTTSLSLAGTPLTIEVIDENFNDIGANSVPIQIESECDGGGGTMPTPCPIEGNTAGVGIIAPETVQQMGDFVCVPITVDNFVDIQSAQGGFEWDPTVLSYQGNQNFVLPGAVLNEANIASGSFVYTWFDGTGITPVTLNDGDVLLEICFNVIGNNGDFSFIFTETQAVNNEFGDSNGNPLPDYTDCGSITIGDPIGPMDNFTLIASDEFAGPGSQTCVTMSAANFVDIASMQFTINWNSSILEYTSCDVMNINPAIQGLACGSFNFFPTDKLRLSWSSPDGSGITLPDTVAMFDVCYDVTGACDSNTPVTFIDDVGVPIEIGDGDANPVTPVSIIPGSVTVSCQLIIDTDITNSMCNGDLGNVNVTISGAQGNTTCQWKDSDGNIISSGSCDLTAAAGCYTLCVTDDLGTTTAEACITEPNGIEFTTDVSDASCSGLGQIIVNASGGNGSPLTCSISPNATESPECTFVDLPAGNYTITVTDGTCDESGTVTVLSTSSIEVDETLTNASCSGLGSISLTVTGNGGVTPTYQWDPSNLSGPNPTGLDAGTYNVTVTVGTCQVMEEYIITNSVSALNVVPNIQNISCNGSCDGSIDFVVTGGCTPYTFSPPLTSLTNLCSGSYTVTITDSSPNPQSFTDIFSITEPDELTASVTEIMDACGDDGFITLDVSGGTEPYSFNWDCPLDPDCPDTEDPTNLVEGNYSVTITDDNQCVFIINDIVVENACPDSLTITGLAVSSEDLFSGFGVACFGDCNGEITATINNAVGTVSISLTDEEGNTTMHSTFPITGLCAGDYDISVSDDMTSVDLNTVTVTEPSLIEISLVDTMCTAFGESQGSIDIDVEGGVGTYEYNWLTGQETQDIENLGVGTYVVSVTDLNGCEDTAMYIVQECGIVEPGENCYTGISVITPNGDGLNDVMTITCATDNPNELIVFDRWGREVYRETDYSGSWNGVEQDGTELMEGAYFWVMEVSFDNGDSRIFKGSVTLLRSL